MKNIKRILAITLIIILIYSIQLPIFNVNAANMVSLKLIPQPYIDVVLAKAKTETDLTTFEQDLRAALKKLAVDTDKVNISAIEAQQVDLQNSFQWEQDVSTSIGSLTLDSTGQNVVMRGNPSRPGKNAIWIIPNDDLKQTFTFGYNIDFGDSFNAAGMLLRVHREGSTLTGYMLSFNNYNWTGSASGQNGAIWKFTYVIGQNGTNMTKTLVKALSINKSGTLTVMASKQTIEVSGGGLSSTQVIDIEDDPKGTGFGFFSDHYSHGCSSIGAFTLQNISLSTEKSKTLEEVLREPDWREDAIKVLVNVEDNINKQLNEPTSLGELLTRMINDEIHYVGWGKDVNVSQSSDFIQANNGNGTFINNINYENSISKTAEYIKSLIETRQSSNYVLLTDNTILSSEDEGIMKNAVSEDFPLGKWKIIHDCEYFENDLGQFEESGNYIKDMITSFDKTGKFEILYEDRNIEPTYIYVHRRPVAEIEVAMTGSNIKLTNVGYDLDKYSTSNKGIEEVKWEHRKVGDTTWEEGMLTSTTGGTDFLVQLTVKDFQGEWSAPANKYITTNQDVKPIASFKIKNRNNSIYEQLEIVDGSYDPYGGKIVDEEWILYKEGRVVTKGKEPVVDYMAQGEGNYTLGLIVTNDRGMKSEEFKRTFTIIPDDEAPEVTATPTSTDWTRSIDVNLTFKDRLGSGFASYQYAITEGLTDATNWSQEITKQNDKITIEQDSIKYLHIKAKDKAGNVSKERIIGPFKIDRTPPVGSVTYDKNQWSIDLTTLHWRFSDAQCGYNRTTLPNEQSKEYIGGYYDVTDNGPYTFTAYDNLGNSTTITEEVTNIDKVAPEIILTPSHTQFTNEPIKIQWNVVDSHSGFNRIILPDNTVSNNAQGEFEISHPGTYSFIAYDNVGNDRTVEIDASNVDLKVPKLTVTQEVKNWTNEDVVLHWKAEDIETGIKEVVLPNSKRETEEEGDHAVSKNGTYTFIAYDKVGNYQIEQIHV